MELDERVLSSAAKGGQLALLLSLWGKHEQLFYSVTSCHRQTSNVLLLCLLTR